MLFQQIDLSGLDRWSIGNRAATHALLAEYHNIFNLELGELGYIDLTKHEIRVVDDEPFKKRFRRIPPPMGNEVRAHVKEISEVGLICPSQSQWCNVIMLVQKKGKSLHFLH